MMSEWRYRHNRRYMCLHPIQKLLLGHTTGAMSTSGHTFLLFYFSRQGREKSKSEKVWLQRAISRCRDVPLARIIGD